MAESWEKTINETERRYQYKGALLQRVENLQKAELYKKAIETTGSVGSSFGRYLTKEEKEKGCKKKQTKKTRIIS